jgi:hypothetical protein
LWPVNFIATRTVIPARTMSDTAADLVNQIELARGKILAR